LNKILLHFIHWSPLLIYVFLILFFSTGGIPEEIQHVPDIFLHSCEYMVLGLFLYYAFVTTFKIESLKLAFILTGIGVFIGIFDEFVQLYTPTRDASIKDIIVDFLALALAQTILYHLKKNNKWIVPSPK
jgi:VanZ family protein